MKKITLEEHFATEEQVNYLRSILEKEYPVPEVIDEETALGMEVRWVPSSGYSSSLRGGNTILDRLLEVGERRLRELDEDGIDMQVLSLVSPGVQMLDAPTATAAMKRYNDRLAGIVREHPERFAGLATLAPQDPGEAADELERAVLELGLKGASINSHIKGEYLDDKKYWVIFERAERLDVPIYIHPRSPSPDMVKPFLTYPALAVAMWGFGAETSLHAMRLICSGVFDQYPGLKIILGHLGEGLTFWLWRLDNRWQLGPTGSELAKKPSDYFRDNFTITTSGMFSHLALQYCCLAVGVERILFAVDYPFESNQAGVQFIEAAPINDSDKEKICHLNAERLLKL
ncbi:MAG: amidohydrolase [Dehalococcoidales bacterium]|nr:MAG: amidohydrolase [Dehalococcoidales bacterium]